MADTRQIVQWSLERPCNFRSGGDWYLPAQTSLQLSSLRTVASAESDGRNVDGICVTSWTTEQDSSGKCQDVPYSGFRIEDKLGQVGGLPAALATCRECEANAKTELGFDVAGCFGYLDVWPDSEELDAQLWEIISERKLEDRFRAAFPITTPLWYGLWINTPLRRTQLEVLHELLTAACDHDDPEDQNVRHFLNGIMAAINWELPVHVSLSPLGHTDFGWYTVFPHCPRCKANAPVGRWKESYTTTPHECRACGHVFIPNDHQSSERDEDDWDSDSLQKQLGKDEYEAFVKKFLIHRGCSDSQAEDVIDNKNDGPLLRRIHAMRKKRQATFQRLRTNPSTTDAPQPTRAITLPLAENLEMDFVLVPAGEFKMGAADPEATSEQPQHSVRMERPFYIGRHLVTQAQWSAVMGNNPSRYDGDPLLPVDQVSWFDCQEFCERLCQKFARVFRLPSEAEWEYACRAGSTTKYAFGDTLSTTQANFTPYADMMPPLPDSEEDFDRAMEELLANSSAPQQRSRDRVPTPIGQYPPNDWGIYDMHGNVNEWCEDVWHPNYEGAPTDGGAWLDGEESEAFRVMRGGWASATEFVCTSSARRQLRADAGSRKEAEPNEDGEEDEFISSLFSMMYTPTGFRVVCEVSW